MDEGASDSEEKSTSGDGEVENAKDPRFEAVLKVLLSELDQSQAERLATRVIDALERISGKS